MCHWNLSDLFGAWLGLELELEKPEELEEPLVLVRWMTLFVLKLACLVDSEVDGSERRTAARISVRQARRESPFSPFWHFLLLLIPC